MKGNVFHADKIKRFDFEDLNGKTLKIVANRNEDGLIVMGLDVTTNEFYVLKSEPTAEQKRSSNSGN